MGKWAGSLTAEAFVEKWSKAQLSERAASQEHFIDLCHILGQPTPERTRRSGSVRGLPSDNGKPRCHGSCWWGGNSIGMTRRPRVGGPRRREATANGPSAGHAGGASPQFISCKYVAN
jgi:hypothetical protein